MLLPVNPGLPAHWLEKPNAPGGPQAYSQRPHPRTGRTSWPPPSPVPPAPGSPVSTHVLKPEHFPVPMTRGSPVPPAGPQPPPASLPPSLLYISVPLSPFDTVSSVSKAQDLNHFLLFSPHKKVNIFVPFLASFSRTSAPRDGLFVCLVAFSVQRTEEGLAGNKHLVNIVRGGNLPSRPGMSAQW